MTSLQQKERSPDQGNSDVASFMSGTQFGLIFHTDIDQAQWRFRIDMTR